MVFCYAEGLYDTLTNSYRRNKDNKLLKKLVKKNVLKEYPPLVDKPDSLVIQFEHTIAIKESGIEVLSRGDDY